ncbi:MAG TPA: DUF1080 domain-containing protein [Acidobacteriota bacterium]|jgi:hypothetical protein
MSKPFATPTRLAVLAVLLLVSAAALASFAVSKEKEWKIHDMDRPQPPVISPPTASTQEAAGLAPSDAIVLFDGKDLTQWRSESGEPTKWKAENGYMESVRGTGYAVTSQSFGDCQLHVEFATPTPPRGESQGRGNSGVFLMKQYETQVLDSYQNKTYPDGQAAAIYGQYPPLVNASRPPGQWQTYDIIFHAPRFDKDGKLLKPARETVLHNGVLVQDNVELMGPTAHQQRPPYKVHPDKMPISLQDHGNPVRYRNIWIRELAPAD